MVQMISPEFIFVFIWLGASAIYVYRKESIIPITMFAISTMFVVRFSDSSMADMFILMVIISLIWCIRDGYELLMKKDRGD